METADKRERGGRAAWRWGRGLAAAVAGALACCGCQAVDVGAPVVDRQTRTVYDTSRLPTRSVVSATRATHRVDGGTVTVGLVADVREEYGRTSHEETTTVTKQRRLAWGFFPAAAEQYCVPAGAEGPGCLKHGYPASFALGLLFVPLGTVHALILEGPFGSYDCSAGKTRNAYAHVGLLGVHKYTVTRREGPVAGPLREEAPKVEIRKSVAVPGPFEIEFSIPDLGHRPAAVLARGGTAAFELPAVSRDRTVRAYVSFKASALAARGDPLVPLALAKAAETPQTFDLTLRAPKPQPVPQPVVTSWQPQPPPPPPPPQRPYEVEEIKREEGGRYTVRLKIADKTRTFDILRVAEAEVRDMVRRDYLGLHAGEDPQYVMENLQFGTEDGGGMLVCSGWAFSARPVEDGWHYDAESRRGWIRLRISGGMPAAEAKKWARDNISAIVREKNVLLEAEKAPPPGATYRSLSEEFKAGVLTVEFKAEQ